MSSVSQDLKYTLRHSLFLFFFLLHWVLVLNKCEPNTQALVKSQLTLPTSIISFDLAVFSKVPNTCLSFFILIW